MENDVQYIFGIHPVMEAVKSGRKIDRILVKKGLSGQMADELLQLAADRSIPCRFVPVEKLDRTVRGAHQGVIAFIANVEYTDLEELVRQSLETSENPLIVMLDEVTDVRNVGAIARSVECAGGAGIIVPTSGGAAINAEAVKASAGALMRIPVCRVLNLKMAAYYLRQSGFRLISATEKTDRDIYEADMSGACAIIVGSEGHGISPAMLKLSDDCVRIPMAGEISSLNVSAATAIVLYEAVRQRIMKKN